MSLGDNSSLTEIQLPLWVSLVLLVLPIQGLTSRLGTVLLVYAPPA